MYHLNNFGKITTVSERKAQKEIIEVVIQPSFSLDDYRHGKKAATEKSV